MGENYNTSLIRNARIRFGEAPRKLDRKLQSYIKVKTPGWIKSSNDELGTVYRDMGLLITQGQVVWGSLVMANNGIFSAGNEDLPGVVVHAADIHRHDDLNRLSDACQKVSELKSGTGRNADEKQLGALLADEMTRFLSHPLPRSIDKDGTMRASCLMFFRKHLPAGRVTSGTMPVLVHPETKAIAVLPGRFWPEDLVNFWLGS